MTSAQIQFVGIAVCQCSPVWLMMPLWHGGKVGSRADDTQQTEVHRLEVAHARPDSALQRILLSICIAISFKRQDTPSRGLLEF